MSGCRGVFLQSLPAQQANARPWPPGFRVGNNQAEACQPDNPEAQDLTINEAEELQLDCLACLLAKV